MAPSSAKLFAIKEECSYEWQSPLRYNDVVAVHPLTGTAAVCEQSTRTIRIYSWHGKHKATYQASCPKLAKMFWHSEREILILYSEDCCFSSLLLTSSEKKLVFTPLFQLSLKEPDPMIAVGVDRIVCLFPDGRLLQIAVGENGEFVQSDEHQLPSKAWKGICITKENQPFAISDCELYKLDGKATVIYSTPEMTHLYAVAPSSICLACRRSDKFLLQVRNGEKVCELPLLKDLPKSLNYSSDLLCIGESQSLKIFSEKESKELRFYQPIHVFSLENPNELYLLMTSGRYSVGRSPEHTQHLPILSLMFPRQNFSHAQLRAISNVLCDRKQFAPAFDLLDRFPSSQAQKDTIFFEWLRSEHAAPDKIACIQARLAVSPDSVLGFIEENTGFAPLMFSLPNFQRHETQILRILTRIHQLHPWQIKKIFSGFESESLDHFSFALFENLLGNWQRIQIYKTVRNDLNAIRAFEDFCLFGGKFETLRMHFYCRDEEREFRLLQELSDDESSAENTKALTAKLHSLRAQLAAAKQNTAILQQSYFRILFSFPIERPLLLRVLPVPAELAGRLSAIRGHC